MLWLSCDKLTPCAKLYRVTKGGKHRAVEVCEACGEEQIWEGDRITTLRKKKGTTTRVTAEKSKKRVMK